MRLQVLRASDMQTRDYLGNSVGISGDHVITGAYYEDGGSGEPVNGAAAAYIFKLE